MALQPVPGLPFFVIPDTGLFRQSGSDGYDGQTYTLNTAGDAVHFTGKVFWRDHGTHTLSAAGGGKIGWHTTTGCLWGTDGSTLRVGIQELSTSAGPPARGDGNWVVYKDLVRGTDTIASSTWYETAMSNGSRDIATGDTLTVVFDLTVKNGSDVVVMLTHGSPTNGLVFSLPVAIFYDGSTYSYDGVHMPMFTLHSDGGELGTFLGTWPVDDWGGTTGRFRSTSTTKEYGNLFTLPWNCRISGMWADIGDDHSEGTGVFNLYSDPTNTGGGVTSVASANWVARCSNGSGAVGNAPEKVGWFPFTTPYDYTANTTMAIAFQATDPTYFFELGYFDAPTAAILDLHQLGQNCRAVSRNTISSGTAFTTYGSTKRRMEMGLLISHIDDGLSAGTTISGTSMRRGMV